MEEVLLTPWRGGGLRRGRMYGLGSPRGAKDSPVSTGEIVPFMLLLGVDSTILSALPAP